jgi:hypothetical protein
MIFTPEDVFKLTNLLNEKLGDFGYFSVSYTALGGEERASLFVHSSRQKEKEWPYGIYHNSDYAIFCLDYLGKMEITSRHSQMPKMRKCNIKSLEDAADRITKYLLGVS